jgi:DNA invertase Pin-like site-specific DNA recombinase
LDASLVKELPNRFSTLGSVVIQDPHLCHYVVVDDHGKRALIYCRISLDTAGKELGVQRQQADAEKLCAARGWDVAGVYADNNISAANGVYRPGYADLLAAMERGDGNVIIVYHLSRLWRNRRERAEGIETLKARRVSIVSVKGPDFDLSSAYGQAMADLLGAFDTMESSVKAERMRSKIEQSALAGGQMAGGIRPYGYALTYKVISGDGEKQRRRITGVSVDPVEGSIVEECARRVLAGEPIASITRGLNDRGVLTSAGHRWNRTTLRRLLCSARISGRREYIPHNSYTTTRPLVGEIVSVTSDWPAIISAADSDRIRALLTRADRRLTTGGARTRLLSGILVCGRCLRPLVGRSQKGKPTYCCNRDTGGCGGLSITGEATDEHIRDLVLTALDSSAMADRLRQREAPEPDLHARIRADEDALTELAADHGNGEISRAEWKAAREPIIARLDAARARLAQSTGTTALDNFIGTYAEMADRWESSNTSQRRALISAALAPQPAGLPTSLTRAATSTGRLVLQP